MSLSPQSRVAVVIPYFQREVGILRRALQSIAQQDYPIDLIEIWIIDDGSPQPAEPEIEAPFDGRSLNIRVLRQTNAGPNEARNRGLAALDASVDYVAFLDSDDAWEPGHLSRAVAALSADAQLNAYFASLYHLGDSVDEFTKANRLVIDAHPIHPCAVDKIRRYSGDMVHQICTANTIFMPTLVIKARALGQVRFPAGHRHGGGDYLYWLALLQAGARFVFSTQAEVKCGRGINMWYANGWGTDGYARRLQDEARFRRRALTEYAQSDATKTALREQLRGLARTYMLDFFSRLRRGKALRLKEVGLFYRENPTVFRAFAEALQQLFLKAR